MWPQQLRNRHSRPNVGSFPVESDASPADSPRDVTTSSSRDGKKQAKPADDDATITARDLLLPGIAVSVVVTAISCLALFGPSFDLPDGLRQIGGKKLKWNPAFQGAYRDTMFWGTYRPGYYWGTRFRMPYTLSAGLMWFDPTHPEGFGRLRHEAKQEDGLDRYGWLEHDGFFYGKQELLDSGYNITTTWVKRQNAGLPRGGDWALNVKVEPYAVHDVFPQHVSEDGNGMSPTEQAAAQRAAADRPISLVFYIHDEMSADWRGYPIKVLPEGPLGPPGGVLASGNSFPVDGWQLHVHDNHPQGAALKQFHYAGDTPRQVAGLTELAKHSFESVVIRKPGQAGGRVEHRLSDTLATQGKLSLGMFQFTAALPVDLDFVFLPGVIDPEEMEFKRRVRKAMQSFLAPLTQLGINPLVALGIEYAGAQAHEDAKESVAERLGALQGHALKAAAAQHSEDFHLHFEETFGKMREREREREGEKEKEREREREREETQQLSTDTTTTLPPGTHKVMQAALANMLGGMGFFYGSSKVLYDKGGGVMAQGQLKATGLFTSVPSRSFFPRGFLWDEGFHLLITHQWSPLVGRDVIAHWLDLMTAEGWIPREQILGGEAEARVPAEFVVQNPTHANPPTLFLPLVNVTNVVKEFVKRMDMPRGSPQWHAGEFLTAAFPRLKAWVLWYHRTQVGPVKGAYRWHGRDTSSKNELNPKTLASGLDDYPRASHPSDIERHLDLRCWMAVAVRTVATIGATIGWNAEEVAELQALAEPLLDFDLLNKLHWDDTRKMYLDYGRHSEGVTLERVIVTHPQTGQPMLGEMQRVVKKKPKLGFVPQFGYVSLFPLLLRLIPPDAPQLGSTLTHLRNPAHIWSDYGLRSLSKSASLYHARNTEHDPPYWRGPIWMNINYLACAALYHYGSVDGPYRTQAHGIYVELRNNLLTNVMTQYEQTGYLWENYNDETGKGQFSKPFTGWTSLVLLIAAEHYPF